jgi:two-component system LytT family sensor kinase
LRKYKLIVLFLLFIMSILIVIYYSTSHPRISVYNGALNLNKANMKENEVVRLNGKWEFYWNQLLEPKDFKAAGKVHAYSYMNVPGNWRKDSSGRRYPDHGVATYRLKLKNITPDVLYGIKKQSIRVASKIYINGRLFCRNGTPSDSVGSEIMGNDNKVMYFKVKKNVAEIIIQVSSHKFSGGGIAESVFFGKQQSIVKLNERNIFYEAIRIAFMLAVGVIYGLLAICIPAYRKKEPAAILFPAVVILFAVINAMLGERIINYFLIGLTSEIMIRIEIVTIYLYTISIVILFNRMEEKLVSKKSRNIIICILSLFLAEVFLFPNLTYEIWMVYCVMDFMIFFGLGGRILYLYLINQSLKINETEHTILLIVIFSVNVYDIDILAFTAGFTGNRNIAVFSSIVYIMDWLFLMIYRYHQILLKNEELTVALLESNYNTKKITNHAMRSEIAFLQAQIKPHFLFNSLSSIMSLCQTDSSKAMLLLGYLSDFLKNAFQVDISSDFICVESELEVIKSYVFIEKTRFGDRLEVITNIEDTLKKEKIIPLLLQPLVENAIKHGALKRETEGIVRLTIQKCGNDAVFSVYDNGPGFSERSKKVLERQEMEADNSLNGQSGVGILNIKNRLQYYYNEILHIEQQTEGVKIWFKIPLSEEVAESVESGNCG